MRDKLQYLYGTDFFNNFNHVRIKDSTKFIAPDTLSVDYKGSGGNAGTSRGGICIQFEYDIKSGPILDLSITSAIRNDQKDAGETCLNVSKGDLILRDLGYFSTSAFNVFAQKGAYFLSRLNSCTSVFDEQGNQFSFQSAYDKMKKKRLMRMQVNVLVGKEQRVPARLMLQFVPCQVYEKRIRDKEKENRKKGKGQMNKQTKLRYFFNLFLTNADEELLPVEKISCLYSLRWQVELVFKCWKSVFKIHKQHKMKQDRYICLLYAKLLLIVVNLQIIYHVQYALYRYQDNSNGQEKAVQTKQIQILSINKSIKTLHAISGDILKLLQQEAHQAKTIAESIQIRLSKNHWLERRKKKIGFLEIIELFICKSE